MPVDPLDLCVMEEDGGMTAGGLSADPFSVLYRDLVPVREKRLDAGQKYGFKGVDSGGPKGVVIEGLPWWVNDLELDRALAAAGMSGVDLIRFYESPVNGKSTGMAAVRFHTSSAAEKCADEFRLYKDSYGEYATKVTRLALEDVRKFEETGVLPQEFLAGAVALPPAAVGGLPVPGHSTEAQAAAVKQALMSSGSAVTANIFAAAGLMAPSAPAQQQQQQPQQQQQQQARALAEALSKLQSANPQQSQAATIAGLRSNLEQLIQQRQHLQQPGGYGAPPPMPQQPMFNPNDGMQGMDFFAAAAKRQLTEAYTPDAKRINRIN